MNELSIVVKAGYCTLIYNPSLAASNLSPNVSPGQGLEQGAEKLIPFFFLCTDLGWGADVGKLSFRNRGFEPLGLRTCFS